MDVFREALLIALGAWDYSRDWVKETVEGLRERGELSKEQADKLLQDLRERGGKEREELEKRFASATKKARSALLFASRDDLKKVERRLAKLEKAIEQLRQAVAQSAEKTQDA